MPGSLAPPTQPWAARPCCTVTEAQALRVSGLGFSEASLVGVRGFRFPEKRVSGSFMGLGIEKPYHTSYSATDSISAKPKGHGSFT